MLLDKADTLIVEGARIALADRLSPFYTVPAASLRRIHAAITETIMRWDMRAEDSRLVRREREAAPLAVDRTGAGRREPAAESQPPLDPQSGRLLRRRA